MATRDPLTLHDPNSSEIQCRVTVLGDSRRYGEDQDCLSLGQELSGSFLLKGCADRGALLCLSLRTEARPKVVTSTDKEAHRTTFIIRNTQKGLDRAEFSVL